MLAVAEPGIACPANLAMTCGVAIAEDGIILIDLMHGRRQAGCRPVGAAPLKCAVCGTVVSWPNGRPPRYRPSRYAGRFRGRWTPEPVVLYRSFMTNPASTGSAYSALYG